MAEGDDVQLPTVIGDGGEILSPDDALRALATRDRDHTRALAFLQDAIAEAEDELLTDRNTFEIDGRREPNAGGYQDLARRFRIETKPVATKVEWEPNQLWLEYGEEATRHPSVAPVPQHCRALVTVRAVAPWGQVVERQRSCSTRGEAFRYANGNFNDKAYMDAEHICVGRAETRAANAAVKAILGLQREDDREAAGAARGAARREEKREEARRKDASTRWRRLLREKRIDATTEAALARSYDALPDDVDEWDADCYEHALELVERYGTRVFDRARQKAAEEDDERQREEDLERAEKEATEGDPERVVCTAADCDGVLEPGMGACPECGLDRDGPPPAGGEGPGPAPGAGTGGRPRGDEDAPDGGGADPDPEAASEATQKDDFARDLEENPVPESADVEGEEEEEGDEGGGGPLARRSRLISQIMTRTKELGEERSYPEQILADVVSDQGHETLDDATLQELQVVLDHLEEELADVEPGGEDG